MPVSRRTFIRDVAVSLAAGSVTAQAQTRSGQQGAPSDGEGLFRHGVASGDPLANRVVLWTRVTPPATRRAIEPIQVEWHVATDERLSQIVARGTTSAAPDRDFTVKVDAAGLEAGRTYFYSFEAGGQRSPLGRTRTLAARAPRERARFAAVSCSNQKTGYFNAYRCLANRDDLDAVIHLGDYIYEDNDVTLADYRRRYAAYRSDVDLQAAHARHPFIATWDDHEIVDNAWSGEPRRAAAYRAYLEWMPVRESTQSGIRLYRAFRIGTLADVVILDTRGLRDRQLAPGDVARLDGGDRSLLGAAQERWLFEQLRRSKGDGTGWRLIGQQIMFSLVNAPGSPVNPDFWEGYPSARTRVVEFLEKERLGNVAILSGDVHSSWAWEVPTVAVELVTPAISSPPLFGEAGMRERMNAVKARLPHLKFMDGDRNGYILLELSRERLLAEWYFVSNVTERSDRESRGAAFVCESGSQRLTPA